MNTGRFVTEASACQYRRMSSSVLPESGGREMNAAGTGFRDLSNFLRASRAKELLRTDGMSVTSVGMELGYSSPANFARAFRAATGMTPRDYRAAAQSRRGTTSMTSRAPARPRPE